MRMIDMGYTRGPSHAGLTPWEIGLWGLRPQLWYDPDQVQQNLPCLHVILCDFTRL